MASKLQGKLYSGNGVIAIRREDKNKWERRAPLAPAHVATLVQKGVRVIVQTSGRRCYPDAAYAAAGAEVQEDISAASTVLCVKEPPIPLLLSHPGRSWVCFSHTIKGQRSNMPLLDAFIASRQRLIDYECITETGERTGKRLVAFGRFAGLAGAVDFTRGLGERLLALGHSTPFLSTGSSYMYRSAAEAKEAVKKCGEQLAEEGLPKELCPFVAAFTGGGNVAKGAQEVWANLPHETVEPSDLQALLTSCQEADRAHAEAVGRWAQEAAEGRAAGPAPPVPEHRRKVYMVSIGRESMVELKTRPPAGEQGASPAKIDREHYSEHPDAYRPVFARDVLPYLSAVFVCHYWEPRFPRLFTARDCGQLWRAGKLRLVGVCDVTCDYMGACDMLTTFTSIEEPFFCCDVGAVGAAGGAGGGAASSGGGDDSASLASAGAGIDVDIQGEGDGWPVAMGVDAGAKAARGDGRGPASRWVLYHAVDHLPSELPRDSTGHFGSALVSMVEGLAWDDQNATKKAFDRPGKAQDMKPTELPAVGTMARDPAVGRKKPDGVPAISPLLLGATITCGGELTPDYRYIAAVRNADERAVRSMAKSGSDQALAKVGSAAEAGSSDGGSPGGSPKAAAAGGGGKGGLLPVEAVRTSSIGDQLLAAAGSQPRASPLARTPAYRVPGGGGSVPRMARAPSYTTMSVRGHLFDNNVINKVLDVVEENDGAANILRMDVGRDGEHESVAALQVFCQETAAPGALGKLIARVEATASELGAVVLPMAVEDAARESAGAANRLAKFQRGGPGDGATAGWSWGLGADASGATHLVPIRADGAEASSGAGGAAGHGFPTPVSLGIAIDERPGRAAGAAPGLPADVLSSVVPVLPKAMPRQAWSRRVLLLGSGLVTAPLLDIMLRDPRNAVVVGSFDAKQARELVARVAGGRLGLPVGTDGGAADPFAAHGRSDGDQLVGGGGAAFSHLSKDLMGGRRCAATFIDVNNQPERLSQLVGGADVVLSLVSAPFHPPVARTCVDKGVNMVTASYTSPAMKEMEAAAKAKGVLLLNECGLDPGIDHATAARCVDRVRAEGGVVTEFSSVCGGLPAPEAATNPLGYKFSWAPRGVLTACKNDSAWLEDGAVRREPGSRLLQTASDIYVNPAFSLEVLPNRDSVAFMRTYGFAPPEGAGEPQEGDGGLAPGARKFYRGTLRYKGYCAQAEAWRRLGWLWESDEEAVDRCVAADGSGRPEVRAPFSEGRLLRDGGISLRRWLAASLGLGGGAEATGEALDAVADGELRGAIDALCAQEPAVDSAAAIRSMQWLGFFGTRVLQPPESGRLNGGEVAAAPPLDVLSHLLQSEPGMGYAVSAGGKQERDMALMRHVVRAEYPPAGGKPARKVRIDSTLIEYGSDVAGGDSAMARTVGYCSAVAAQMLMDGRLGGLAGCATPVQQVVYEPLLEGLEGLGIRMEEEEVEE